MSAPMRRCRPTYVVLPVILSLIYLILSSDRVCLISEDRTEQNVLSLKTDGGGPNIRIKRFAQNMEQTDYVHASTLLTIHLHCAPAKHEHLSDR